MPPKLSQKQTVIVNIGDKVIKKKKKRKRRVKKSAATPSGVAYPSSFVAQQITLAQQAQSLQLQSLANKQGHNNLITDGRDSEIKRITAERDEGLRLLEQQRSAQAALPPARPVSAPRDASVRDMSAQPDVRPEFQRINEEIRRRTRGGFGFRAPTQTEADEPPPAFKPINIARETAAQEAKSKAAEAKASREAASKEASAEAAEFLAKQNVTRQEAAVKRETESASRIAKFAASAKEAEAQAEEMMKQATEARRLGRQSSDSILLKSTRPIRKPSPPPSPKQVEKQETIEFLKGEEAKKIELAPPVLPEKRQRATKEEMRIRREQEAEKFSQKRETVLMADSEYTQREIARRRAELPPPPPPPPIPPPPLSKLKLATQTSADKPPSSPSKSPRSPAVARTLSDPKVLSEKKLSSGRDTLMTEDQKALEAVLATTSDIDERLKRQQKADKKAKQESQESKDKKSALQELVKSRKDLRSISSDSIERDVLFAPANAPTESPLFSNPARISSLDFVTPSPSPARPQVKKLNSVPEPETETIKIRKRRPPKKEGGANPLKPSRSTSPRRSESVTIGRPEGSSLGRHPLRTAFYETPPGELGGAEDTGLNL